MTKFRMFVIAMLALLVSGQSLAWESGGEVIDLRSRLQIGNSPLRYAKVMVAEVGDHQLPSVVLGGKEAGSVVQTTNLALNSRLANKLGVPNRFPGVTWEGTKVNQKALNVKTKPGLSYLVLVNPEGLAKATKKTRKVVKKSSRKKVAKSTRRSMSKRVAKKRVSRAMSLGTPIN